jgi:hypothetical protein
LAQVLALIERVRVRIRAQVAQVSVLARLRAQVRVLAQLPVGE